MMAFQSFKLCTSQRADLDLCINKCASWASNAFKATSMYPCISELHDFVEIKKSQVAEEEDTRTLA